MSKSDIKYMEGEKMKGMLTFTPLKTAFLLLWTITTVVIIWTLQHDVRVTDHYNMIRRVLHISYVLILLWYISQTGQSSSLASDFRGPESFRSKWSIWISVSTIIRS